MLVNDATKILETKYFENASKIGTVKAYKKHIELYPDGSHLEKARLIIDMLTFKPYDERGSVRSLKKFIRKYPGNRYVNEAKQKIAQLTLASESKSIKPSFWIWMVIINLFSIAIISLVVLKREKISQFISNFVKKREAHNKEEKTMTGESINNIKFQNKSTEEVSGMGKKSSAINNIEETGKNNSIPMQRIVKTENLCAIALIIFFFLPWAQLFGFGASGFKLTQFGSYANLAWLIPVFSGITIAIGLAGGSQREIGAITGFIPFVGLIYGLTKIGNDIFHVLAIGAYLTLIVSIAMILSAIGVVNMPINNKKE